MKGIANEKLLQAVMIAELDDSNLCDQIYMAFREGADINARTFLKPLSNTDMEGSEGYTPAMILALKGFDHALSFLAGIGADLSLKNALGRDAAYIAKYHVTTAEEGLGAQMNYINTRTKGHDRCIDVIKKWQDGRNVPKAPYVGTARMVTPLKKITVRKRTP